MYVSEIKFLVRKNKGNYEHEENQLSAVIAEGEDAYRAGVAVKEQAYALLGMGPKPVSEPVKNEKAVAEEKVKEEPKKEEVKETPKTEEVKAKKAPKEVASKAPAKKEPVKKEVKTKPAVKYNRTEDTHREEFASILGKEFPGWASDADLKSKAKACSMAMDGEYIFDSEGKVLESFVASIKAKMR